MNVESENVEFLKDVSVVRLAAEVSDAMQLENSRRIDKTEPCWMKYS